jgi:hypothetical protein
LLAGLLEGTFSDHSVFVQQTPTSPVPAGRRVAFFAGPKKVTKETTGAALGMK